MNRIVAANIVGAVLCVALSFGLVTRAKAFYSGCDGNIILCGVGCLPEIDWTNPFACCSQTEQGCCLRNCFDYNCSGPMCIIENTGVNVPQGVVVPGLCGFHPDCSNLGA